MSRKQEGKTNGSRERTTPWGHVERRLWLACLGGMGGGGQRQGSIGDTWPQCQGNGRSNARMMNGLSVSRVPCPQVIIGARTMGQQVERP